MFYLRMSNGDEFPIEQPAADALVRAAKACTADGIRGEIVEIKQRGSDEPLFVNPAFISTIRGVKGRD